jgi:hypothetical protein
MSGIMKWLKLVLVFILFILYSKMEMKLDSETGKHNCQLWTMGDVQETFRYLKLSIMYSKLKLYHALEVLLAGFPFSFPVLFA